MNRPFNLSRVEKKNKGGSSDPAQTSIIEEDELDQQVTLLGDPQLYAYIGLTDNSC